jgi:hypothetical protein
MSSIMVNPHAPRRIDEGERIRVIIAGYQSR